MCGLHLKLFPSGGWCAYSWWLMVSDYIWLERGKKGREKTQDIREKTVQVFHSSKTNQSIKKKKKIVSKFKKCKRKIYHRKLLLHHTFYLWSFNFLTYKHFFLTHQWTRRQGRIPAKFWSFNISQEDRVWLDAASLGKNISVYLRLVSEKALTWISTHDIDKRGPQRDFWSTGNIVCLCLVSVPWVLVLILVLSCTCMFLYLSERMV